MQRFNTIDQYITHLKCNENIVGIVEYGGRSYTNMEEGGDYDLTVFHNVNGIKSIGGVHFHIAGIPVDCMLKNINEFEKQFPLNQFDYVHLNCHIIYDKNGYLEQILNRIKTKHSKSSELTQRNINMYRFTFQHIIDKLKYRLYQDELYSQYFLTSSMDWFLECYANIVKLERGKPKLVFSYIKKHESNLYNLIKDFYNKHDLQAKYNLLIKIANYMLRDIGGVWKENELLYHLNSDSSDEKEEQSVINLLSLNL